MPETEPIAEDRELARWYDEAEAALDEAIRQHVRRFTAEHPPPPRPFPVRLTLDAGEVEFLFPDGPQQNARRARQREAPAP